jgi:prepilin-type N-terminal cleavage/methylation domain-containing protein
VVRGPVVRGSVVRGPVVRGFSLMELILVLAVLAIAAAVVAPGIGRSADGVRARAEVGAVAAFLRFARERAVSRQQALEVRVDDESHTLVMRHAGQAGEAGGRATRAFSPLLRIAADPGPPRVTFLQHGMSTGARFAVATPGPRTYVITVDALTGRVSTARAGS